MNPTKISAAGKNRKQPVTQRIDNQQNILKNDKISKPEILFLVTFAKSLRLRALAVKNGSNK